MMGGIGGVLGGPQGLLNALGCAEKGSGLSKALEELMKDVGGAMGNLQNVLKTVGGPPVPDGILDKALFLSVLRAAIQKATESRSFNLETQVNDLWIKLSQIRQTQSQTDKIEDLLGKRNDLLNVLQQMTDKYNQTARNLMQNMR